MALPSVCDHPLEGPFRIDDRVAPLFERDHALNGLSPFARLERKGLFTLPVGIEELYRHAAHRWPLFQLIEKPTQIPPVFPIHREMDEKLSMR